MPGYGLADGATVAAPASALGGLLVEELSAVTTPGEADLEGQCRGPAIASALGGRLVEELLAVTIPEEADLPGQSREIDLRKSDRLRE